MMTPACNDLLHPSGTCEVNTPNLPAFRDFPGLLASSCHPFEATLETFLLDANRS